MNVIQRQRKKQIAEYLTAVLAQLNMQSSRQILREEASLQVLPNIKDSIQKIKESGNIFEQDKQKYIQQFFMHILSRAIRLQGMQQALTIFQNELPNHVKDVQQYCMLFANEQNVLKQQLQINQIFIDRLFEQGTIPEIRTNTLKLQADIFFISIIKDYLMVVDSQSTGYVIRNNNIISKKFEIHEGKTKNLIAYKQNWITFGEDNSLKIWNKTLQIVFQLNYNCNIKAIGVNQTYLIVCNKLKQTIAYKQQSNMTFIQNIKFKTTKQIIDIHSIKNQKWFVLSKDTNKTQVLILSSNFKNIKIIAKINYFMVSSCVSPCKKYGLINLNCNKIFVYNLQDVQPYCVIQDYVQKNFRMRMDVGGVDGKIVAISSEDGYTYLYDLRKKIMSAKLKNGSGKSNNAVKWMGYQLFCGCDVGNIQRWSTLKEFQNKKSIDIQI